MMVTDNNDCHLNHQGWRSRAPLLHKSEMKQGDAVAQGQWHQGEKMAIVTHGCLTVPLKIDLLGEGLLTCLPWNGSTLPLIWSSLVIQS